MNKYFLILSIIFITFFVSCELGSISSKNTAPIAEFIIDPSTGSTAKIFNFDASGCTDDEDSTDYLQVRWDWESDGNYDTEYSTTKTATHQYSSEGTFTVNLEVKDKGGLTNTIQKEVKVCNSCVMTDIDGNEYQIVTIGSQVWMAENLKVTRYKNGDVIPNVTDDNEWSNLSTGAYCSYSNSDYFVKRYGLLYNWFAVNDIRNLAPEGWHIPTDDEWKELELYLGMDPELVDIPGYLRTQIGVKLKSTSGWKDDDLINEWGFDWRGTNTSGFTALPGGGRFNYGPFYAITEEAHFWTSTESTNTYSWERMLKFDGGRVGYVSSNKGHGFSVRCIKD